MTRNNATVDDLVDGKVPAVLTWATERYRQSARALDSQPAPVGDCEWMELMVDCGIHLVPARLGGQGAALVRHRRHGWLCLVDRAESPERRASALAREYCEWLMAGCAVLGRGRPPRFPHTPNAEVRARIASRVAAELSRHQAGFPIL